MQDLTPEHEGWNRPLALEGASLAEWPKNVFPEPYNSFVSELSRATETPSELAAMLVLSGVATVSQKHFQVQIKRGYFEPVNLWTIGILPPASRKSSVFNEVTRPIKDWEFAQKEILSPIIESMTSKHKTLEMRLKELRSKAAKSEDDKYETIQREIERLENEKEEIPTLPQLWTADVTPEHLGTIMEVNAEAMSILSDEGVIFDILGGLYSDGRANIDLFLQAHAAASVRVDRGSRPPVFMKRPVLTLGITIQPQSIRAVCSNKTFRGRGLLGRALYVFPKSNIGTRSCKEEPMNGEVREQYHDALKNLLGFESYNKSLITLTLSDAAFEKWEQNAVLIEKLMSEDIGHLSHITDWAGKLPGAIARLAGLLHIMRTGNASLVDTIISNEDMTSAIRIGHVLQSHALKTFDLIKESESLQMAKAILTWVKLHGKAFFSLRETYREATRRFPKEIALQAIELLEDHEIIRALDERLCKKGRPSDRYAVNPYIHD